MKRFFSLLLLLPALLAPEPPPWVAIRDARIVRVGAPVIPKGTVLIRETLVEAVGENVTVPPGAWVMDGAGLTVYPGLVDALSSWGLPQAAPASEAARSATRGAAVATPPSASEPAPPVPQDRPLNTSWVRAADQVSPSDRRLAAARSAGFTTAVTFPQSGILAGHGAVLNLAGETAGNMVVDPSAGLYVSLQGNRPPLFPSSLMGVIAYLRQTFLDLEHYRLARQLYERAPRGSKRWDYDRALEGMLSLPRVLLPATRAVEIERMIRLARELKVQAVLYGVHEGYRAGELLKRQGMDVLVNLKWPERSRTDDPDQEEPLRVLEMWDQAPSTPAALAKAGVRFAFYTGGLERPADALQAVRRAISAGLSEEEAVRALTLSAAEIYGVADRLGSVERGKIANLVVTSGSLFQEKPQIKYVFIDGKRFEPAAERGEEVNQ